MELRHYLAILRQRLLPIALAVIAAALAGYMNTDRTQVYSSSTTIYIGASQFSLGAAADLSGDRTAGLDRIISTYAAMVDSDPIAQEAVTSSGLAVSSAAVVAKTDVAARPGTNLLIVRVSDPDPVLAQRLSVAMAQAFIDKLAGLAPGEVIGEGQVPSIAATIFERARLPTTPAPVGTMGNIIVGAVFGLVLSCGTVLLIEYLDVTLKTAEDTERRLELPVLGMIPNQRQGLSMPALAPPRAEVRGFDA